MSNVHSIVPGGMSKEEQIKMEILVKLVSGYLADNDFSDQLIMTTITAVLDIVFKDEAVQNLICMAEALKEFKADERD